MNQKRNIRFLHALFLLHIVSLLVISGCKENRWKNYSPEDRIEIEKGCTILTPLQFKAVIRDHEWQDYHGKRRPKRIHAEVIDFQECPELELSKAFEGKSWFDFSRWPKIELIGEDELFRYFKLGDTLVKEYGACAFSNPRIKKKPISLYYPYRR